MDFKFKLLDMTKKEYILAVIDALPDWEMGRWIKAMVQNDQLEDATIDKLVVIFKKVMQEITDSIRENKVIENLQAMQHLDQQKQKQAEQDAKSLEELDSKLNDF